MSVNSNPLFTAFLYTWFGRLANPTYPSSCRGFAGFSAGLGAGALFADEEYLKFGFEIIFYSMTDFDFIVHQQFRRK